MIFFIVGILLIILISLVFSIKISINISVISISSTNLKTSIDIKLCYKKINKTYYINLHTINNLLDSLSNPASSDQKNSHKFIQFNRKEDIKIIDTFLKSLKIDKLSWISVIGLEEADKTGFYTGSLWAFKGVLLSLLSTKTKLSDFKIVINPDFEHKTIKSELICILSIRIVHIINISLAILLAKVRRYYKWIQNNNKQRIIQLKG